MVHRGGAMRHAVGLGLMAAVMASGLPGVSWAQQEPEPDQEKRSWETQQRELFSQPARQRFYQEAKLEVSGGMWRSALLPGWGNVWADQVFKGVALFAGFGIGVTVFAGGIWREDTAFMISGGALGVACYATSLVTTYMDVHQYNTQLQRRYKLATGQDPLSLGWSWAF